jgi:hypothetical protein
LINAICFAPAPDGVKPPEAAVIETPTRPKTLVSVVNAQPAAAAPHVTVGGLASGLMSYVNVNVTVCSLPIAVSITGIDAELPGLTYVFVRVSFLGTSASELYAVKSTPVVFVVAANVRVVGSYILPRPLGVTTHVPVNAPAIVYVPFAMVVALPEPQPLTVTVTPGNGVAPGIITTVPDIARFT